MRETCCFAAVAWGDNQFREFDNPHQEQTADPAAAGDTQAKKPWWKPTPHLNRDLTLLRRFVSTYSSHIFTLVIQVSFMPGMNVPALVSTTTMLAGHPVFGAADRRCCCHPHCDLHSGGALLISSVCRVCAAFF